MSVALFVGGLPYSATSQDVARFFWDWLAPESVSVRADRDTGHSKGFAIVKVHTPEDAVTACLADGYSLDGSRIVVRVSGRVGQTRTTPSRLITTELARTEGLAVVSLTTEGFHGRLERALTTNESCDIWTRQGLSRFNIGDSDEWASVRLEVGRLVDVLAARPELLTEIHPRIFEHVVAALFSTSGYQGVTLTLPSADGGVDIFANRMSAFGPSLYVVQCKRYSPLRKVTRPEVQLTYGVLADTRATKAVIVTTSSFTRPAQQLLTERASHLGGLDLAGLSVWLQATSQLRANLR